MIFLKIVLLFLPLLCFVQGQSITAINFDWYENNFDEINTKIKNGKVDEAIPLINTVYNFWKNRDGAIGSEVSPAIVNSIIYHPDIIFALFEKDNEGLEYWIDHIPSYVLRYEKEEEKIQIEKIKNIMIDSLVKFSKTSENDKYIKMASEVLSKLMNSKITSYYD